MKRNKLAGLVGSALSAPNLSAYSVILLALCFTTGAQAAGSMLRVACGDGGDRTEITINGAFKGECPLDIQVDAGTVQILAVKKIDELHEQVFSDEFRIGEGVVKKIEVSLSAPRLNADGRRIEAQQEAERQRQIAEAEQRAQEAFLAQSKLAEAGDPDAMLKLADIYATGQGVPKSDQQAADWSLKAAATGNPHAMFKLGQRYENGANIGKSYAQALIWHRKAADADDAGGMGAVAAFYYNGWGVAKDPKMAMQWAQKAAAAGDGRGMLILANLYRYGLAGLKMDYPQFLSLLDRAAAAGEPRAVYLMGTVYYSGANQYAKDEAMALLLFKKAALSGVYGGAYNANSMYMIGVCYKDGKGVPADMVTALAWFRKAAEAGSASAMKMVGSFYYEGVGGVAKSYEIALQWFNKGSDGGDSGAALSIAYFYQQGLGGMPVNKDWENAWTTISNNFKLQEALPAAS